MFKHLKDVNETYVCHFIKAAGFAVNTFLVSLVFLVHAIFPFLFERTGSTQLQRILDKIKLR